MRYLTHTRLSALRAQENNPEKVHNRFQGARTWVASANHILSQSATSQKLAASLKRLHDSESRTIEKEYRTSEAHLNGTLRGRVQAIQRQRNKMQKALDTAEDEDTNLKLIQKKLLNSLRRTRLPLHFAWNRLRHREQKPTAQDFSKSIEGGGVLVIDEATSALQNEMQTLSLNVQRMSTLYSQIKEHVDTLQSCIQELHTNIRDKEHAINIEVECAEVNLGEFDTCSAGMERATGSTGETDVQERSPNNIFQSNCIRGHSATSASRHTQRVGYPRLRIQGGSERRRGSKEGYRYVSLSQWESTVQSLIQKVNEVCRISACLRREAAELLQQHEHEKHQNAARSVNSLEHAVHTSQKVAQRLLHRERLIDREVQRLEHHRTTILKRIEKVQIPLLKCSERFRLRNTRCEGERTHDPVDAALHSQHKTLQTANAQLEEQLQSVEKQLFSMTLNRSDLRNERKSKEVAAQMDKECITGCSSDFDSVFESYATQTRQSEKASIQREGEMVPDCSSRCTSVLSVLRRADLYHSRSRLQCKPDTYL